MAWLLSQELVGQIAVLDWILRNRPTLRMNNGSIVIRVRIDGVDRRIYRLGRWDDPVEVARAKRLLLRSGVASIGENWMRPESVSASCGR